jgi:hypothetical protein
MGGDSTKSQNLPSNSSGVTSIFEGRMGIMLMFLMLGKYKRAFLSSRLNGLGYETRQVVKKLLGRVRHMVAISLSIIF